MVFNEKAGERLLDFEGVEFGVQVSVSEVVKADGPRGITRVKLHQLGNVDVARL